MRKLLLIIMSLGMFISGSVVYAQTAEEEDLEHGIMVAKNTRNGKEIILNLKVEKDFADALHFMTHQKVEAFMKWGTLELTEERVDAMLEILEDTNFVHQFFYKRTLEQWKEGNFKNVVMVHNRIWEMAEGDIGKATAYLDEQEEESYIKEHYR